MHNKNIFLYCKENCGEFTLNAQNLLIPASMASINTAQSATINNSLIAGSLLAAQWAQVVSSNVVYQLTPAALFY